MYWYDVFSWYVMGVALTLAIKPKKARKWLRMMFVYVLWGYGIIFYPWLMAGLWLVVAALCNISIAGLIHMAPSKEFLGMDQKAQDRIYLKAFFISLAWPIQWIIPEKFNYLERMKATGEKK